MNPRLNLWLMRLPLWRWLARVFERPSPDELEQSRDAKTRLEFGVFRPYRPELDDNDTTTRAAIEDAKAGKTTRTKFEDL